MTQSLVQHGMQEETGRGETISKNRYMGHVVSCNGARATVSSVAELNDNGFTARWSVGKLLSIDVGKSRIVAMAVSMQTDNGRWTSTQENRFHVELELMGEVAPGKDGRDFFSSGIGNYPHIGSPAHEISPADLRLIYGTENSENCVVGKLSQNDSIDAAIHMPSMLSKHFAIVGSTGVGKSTTVSLLLHHAITSDSQLRVLILDPHNEFTSAFPDHASPIDMQALDLPFWLMRLDEFLEVVYRSRPVVHDEVEVLRDLIPEAKRLYRGESSFARRQAEKSVLTIDTPAPYRMTDLLGLLDERIGRLEGREEKPMLRSLKLRLISVMSDPHYRFMFTGKGASESITEITANLFRIPGDGRPITTLQLGGVPSEVVNCLASVLCRMAFEAAVASQGGFRILVVCEEAHRYIPADPSLGFAPSRAAIARIAKEGRKYGCSIGVITQRPGELDATILSQCSTFFAMRLTNDRDKEIVRNAIPDSTSSIVNFITSIGNGEAIAFGEALPIPMRVKFERVNPNNLPKAIHNSNASDDIPDTYGELSTIAKRLRNSPSNEGFSNQDSFADVYDSQSIQPAQFRSPAQPPELESYRPDMLSGLGSSQNSSGSAPSPFAADRPSLRKDLTISLRESPFRRSTLDPNRR